MVNDPWDVDAESEQPSNVDQLRAIFQSLLIDRFKLRFHTETKEVAGYILSQEKSGSKLKLSDARDPFDDPIKAGDRRGVRIGAGASISDLWWNLSFSLNVPVVDETGLHGYYDFTLDPSSARVQQRPGPQCGPHRHDQPTAWFEVGISQGPGRSLGHRSCGGTVVERGQFQPDQTPASRPGLGGLACVQFQPWP